MAFDIGDPFGGTSLKGLGHNVFKGTESFLDKNFNLRLFDTPEFPNIRKPKKRKDMADIMRALQTRILRSARPGAGRAATVGTSSRGVTNG